MKVKKRPFLLIELFIAIGLLSLFSIPLLNAPTFHFKKNIESLQEIELNRHAELTMVEILSRIKEDYPWKTMSGIKRESVITQLSPITIAIDQLPEATYLRSYRIWIGRPRGGKKENFPGSTR